MSRVSSGRFPCVSMRRAVFVALSFVLVSCGGSGGGGGDVAPVATYTVGVTVVGLLSPVVLQNNGGDRLAISVNGAFTFSTPIGNGGAYAVTVLTQPSSPAQTCTVSNGSGTVAGANVTSVGVKCMYTVGGTVSIPSGTLVLQNNGGDDLSISAGGSFVFGTALNTGANFQVTILSAPIGQECTVANGSGTMETRDISDVNVLCTAPIDLQAAALSKTITLSWTELSDATYDLYRSTEAGCNFDNYGACTGGALVTDVKPPFDADALDNGTPYYFQLKASYSGGHGRASNVAAARPAALVTDVGLFSGVSAIASGSDGTVYFGGDFTQIGVGAGSGVPFSKVNSWPASWDYAQVVGFVYAAVPDGSGGFFIGGKFTSVGGEQRENAAHVRADGTVDPIWAPKINGAVNAISVGGTTVYVAGGFTSIDGLTRNNIAALDATSGVATAWDPNATSASYAAVYALAVQGNVVYAAGHFSAIGGQTRNNIAGLDVTSGLATAWDPNSSGSVYALVINGDIAYAGGYFTTIGGQARSNVAALDLVSGLATAWNPNADFFVNALAVHGKTIYVGGDFNAIGGQSRSKIAAVEATTGAATSWNPGVDFSGEVNALAIDGGILFVGGEFTRIGGQARNNVAALDVTNGLAIAWAPNTNHSVKTVVASTGAIYVGGFFNMIGGVVTRSHLAAVASDGTLSDWNPEVTYSGPNPYTTAEVSAIAVKGNTVYVGGQITAVGGKARKNIAAIDAASGQVTSWDPSANSLVNVIIIDGNSVYAGGYFSVIGGQNRNGIASLNATSGAATEWNPSAGSSTVVWALAVQGGTVYVGGRFSSIGGQTRNNIAGLDTTNGLATAWDPNSSDDVYALAIDGDTVYAGGYFTSIGGQPRNRIASLAIATGLATQWDPNSSGSVSALAISGATVYAGGVFKTIGGQTRNSIAALDTGGNANAWDPSASQGFVQALYVNGDTVYVGGDFAGMSGKPSSGFAAIAR